MNQIAQGIWDGLELRTPRLLELIADCSAKDMLWQPPNNANSIAWQFWHIAEVEDNQIRALVLNQPKRYPFNCSVRDAEHYPNKETLNAYFHEVRHLSKQRLAAISPADFGRVVEDTHFGTVTISQVWNSVMTSLAWHSGQIALTYRLLGKAT